MAYVALGQKTLLQCKKVWERWERRSHPITPLEPTE